MLTNNEYTRLTEQLWLEDAPAFIEDEYWCPELEQLDWADDNFGRSWLVELKQRDLIFEEWEIKQQEQYVGV